MTVSVRKKQRSKLIRTSSAIQALSTLDLTADISVLPKRKARPILQDQLTRYRQMTKIYRFNATDIDVGSKREEIFSNERNIIQRQVR